MKVVAKKARGTMIDEAGETEGARRATGVFPAGAPPAGAAGGTERADVEVVAKAERRRFTAEYKRRIVREADRCTKSGEIGALLSAKARSISVLPLTLDESVEGVFGPAGRWERGRIASRMRSYEVRVDDVDGSSNAATRGGGAEGRRS